MLKIGEENDSLINKPKKEGSEKIYLKGEILGISISSMESFKSIQSFKKILRGCMEQRREMERKKHYIIILIALVRTC